MSLTLRRNKGSELTWDEVDDNFEYLKQKSEEVIPGTSGGTVLYSGDAVWQSGLTYYVFATDFEIDNVDPDVDLYSYKTLAALDENTYPGMKRTDVFAVEHDGNGNYSLVVVQGTPDPAGTKPTLDASYQLEISWGTVSAGATQPDNVDKTVIYAEGEPEEFTITGGHSSIDTASTDAPITGNISIKHTNVPQNTILNFTTTTPILTSSELALVLSINLQTEWEWKNNNRITIDVYLLNNGNVYTGRIRIGSDFGLNFDGSKVGETQKVIIRLDRFNDYYSKNDFNGLRFVYKRTENEIFRVDDIEIVNTISPIIPTIPKATADLINNGMVAGDNKTFIEADYTNPAIGDMAYWNGTEFIVDKIQIGGGNAQNL